MPGLQIQLNTEFTDLNLPRFYPDSRMTKGSLLLLDFSHPDGLLTSVPGNGSLLNNIAWKNAKEIIPSGTQTTLSSLVGNNVTDPSKGIMKITPKKGLHGIISQVNDINSGNDFVIGIPDLIRDYIFNNIARGFYVSIWRKATRLSLINASSFFTLSFNSTSNYISGILEVQMLGVNLGSRHGGQNTNNQLLTFGVSAKTGTPSANFYNGFKWGSNGAYAGGEVNKSPSQILYQIHIMDLTSAGLTYAQADALDLTAFNAAFGVGGRFYGDTFTAPNTLV